jgi:hypothetical protein
MNIEGYDLDTHEFADYAVSQAQKNDIAVTLDTSRAPWVAIYKGDAIALAKHFKLTREDIEE